MQDQTRQGWWARWRAHCEMVRTRRALLDMPEHRLRDIGLSEDAALREAWRPVWDYDVKDLPTRTFQWPLRFRARHDAVSCPPR